MDNHLGGPYIAYNIQRSVQQEPGRMRKANRMRKTSSITGFDSSDRS